MEGTNKGYFIAGFSTMPRVHGVGARRALFYSVFCILNSAFCLTIIVLPSSLPLLVPIRSCQGLFAQTKAGLHKKGLVNGVPP